MKKQINRNYPNPLKFNLDKIASDKNIGIRYNVTFRVIDSLNGNVIQEHIGHNEATNSLLTGMGHYLKGDGVLNQGYYMLSNYVPRYISLGVMGLFNQEEDEEGLPAGLGYIDYKGMKYSDLALEQLKKLNKETGEEIVITDEDCEILQCSDYIQQVPGYGADGYDESLNNHRDFFGLGPAFKDRPVKTVTANCELISDTFPREEISYRELVPETAAELPETVDIVYSAMISTGALSQFREKGKDYIFITESGLWSDNIWKDGGDNGLLAGYRIVPPNEENWGMVEYKDITKEKAKENRKILKSEILRVGLNQVVQVIWKIQLGAMDQLGGLADLYPQYQDELVWYKWDR